MGDLAAGSIIAKRPDNVQSQVDDEIVLLDLASGQFFSLAGTARRIWDLLDEQQDFGALVAALVEEYAVDEATCAAEVSAMLRDLETRKLVTISG